MCSCALCAFPNTHYLSIIINVRPTMPSSRDHLRKLPILHIHVVYIYLCLSACFAFVHHWWSWVFFIVTINNTVFSKLPTMCEREDGWLRVYLHNQNSMFKYSPKLLLIIQLLSNFSFLFVFFLLSFSVRRCANVSMTSPERFVTSITWRYSFSRRCWRYIRQFWTKKKNKEKVVFRYERIVLTKSYLTHLLVIVNRLHRKKNVL